jgi:hypothetical protein
MHPSSLQAKVSVESDEILNTQPRKDRFPAGRGGASVHEDPSDRRRAVERLWIRPYRRHAIDRESGAGLGAKTHFRVQETRVEVQTVHRSGAENGDVRRRPPAP